jgi:hypothetical protein
MSYIKNLNVIYSSDTNVTLPSPWQKVPVDLNKGARGLYIYLFKLVGSNNPLPGTAVTGVSVLRGQNPVVPPGYVWDDTDLNKSVGGEYLYLAWTYSTDLKPILDVDVVYGDSRDEALNKRPSGWKFVDVDLNKGAGGKWIYLIYRQ